MSAQSLVTKVVTTLGQLALAALLMPEAFGLIAMAYAVRAYASVIQEAGIREFLIREQSRMGRWTNAGMWLVALLGFGAAALMAIAAWPAAMLFEEPRITGLVLVLAIGQPALALAIVPQAALERDLSFKWVALTEAVTATAQMLLMIVLAWAGLDAYSFAIAVTVTAWLRLWMFWHKARPEVRLTPQTHRWPRFFRAGLPTTGAAVLERTMQQSDYIVLGLIAKDPAVVGQYFFAFNQSTMVAQLFVQSLIRILVSSLSALKDDLVRQAEAFMQAVRVLALIAAPLGVLQATLARPMLTLLFGDRWASAIPLLELLSIVAGMNAASWPAIGLLMAQGRYMTRLWFRLYGAIAFVIVAIVSAWLGYRSLGEAEGSAVGMAIGVGLFRLVNGPLAVWIGVKVGGVRLVSVLDVLYRPLVGACLTLIPAAMLTRYGIEVAGIEPWLSHVVHLVVSPAIGVLLFWVWCKLMHKRGLKLVRVQFERVLPGKLMRLIPSWVW